MNWVNSHVERLLSLFQTSSKPDQVSRQSSRAMDTSPGSRRIVALKQGQLNQHSVKRQFRALWEERGWRWHHGVRLEGYYRTPLVAFRGRIEAPNTADRTYYIINPPEALWSHSHAKCFIPQRKENEYVVHFSKRPDSIDSGIMAIERILNEALGVVGPDRRAVVD